MKIGILSLALHTNYGGILQSYALQTILERMGHDVKVIYRPVRKEKKKLMWLRYIKRTILKLGFSKDIDIFKENNWNKKQRILETHTSRFIKKYIHTRIIRRLEDLKPTEFDSIVVGSDQVWRPYYFNGHYNCDIDGAYLSFAQNWNIQRIAYAASFGTNIWEYNEKQTHICCELVKKFQAVSTREESGISLCKNYLCVNAKCVLDPTLLLNKEDYLKLIDKKKAPGDLMVYILDNNDDIDNLISIIAEQRKLKPFKANISPNIHHKEKITIQPPIEDWLRGFRDAKFIITDSFHACVFSILFNKPFVVLSNEKRGKARLESLLAKFNLGERILGKTEQFHSELFRPLPDNISTILKNLQKDSLDFLNLALQ